jgi:hypothetical protein
MLSYNYCCAKGTIGFVGELLLFTEIALYFAPPILLDYYMLGD